MPDIVGEMTVRVAADIEDLERKLGQQLPADLDKSAARVRALQSQLGSTQGAEFGDVLGQRIERASNALAAAKQRASDLTATLATMRTEQASLIDFTTRAAKGPQFVTPAEVAQFSPALMSNRLEQLTGSDQSKGLIEKTEAALGGRIIAVQKSQDRLGDLLAQQLTRNVRTAESAATGIEQQAAQADAAAARTEQRAARGFGQGILRGAAIGTGLPLYYGLVTVAGLLAGETIGKAFAAANEQITKTQNALAALRSQTGLSVEGTAKLAATAQAAGVSIEALGTAEAALHGKGIAFDDAITKLRSIEDVTDRAIEATRLFGAEQAKAVAPLLTAAGPTNLFQQPSLGGRIRPADADQQQQASHLAYLQRVDQLNKALDARSGGTGSTFAITGIIEFLKEAGTGLNFLTQQTKAQEDAERAFLESHPGAAYEEIHQAGLDAIETFKKSLQASTASADELDRVAQIAQKFSGAQNAGTQSLIEMSKAARTTDDALKGLGTAMDAAERKAVGISKSLSSDLIQQFNKLDVAGFIAPDTAQAVKLLVQADVDPRSVNAIFEQLQGISDLASSTITAAFNESTAASLRTIGENRLQSVLSIQEQRVGITQRIADIEDQIAQRQAQNAKLSFDFSKAELDQKLRDRENEKAFFSFRDTGKTDTSKQDARDRAEIAKLQQQLADSQRVHPDLAGEITRAEALRDSLDSIANIITGSHDLTLTHRVVVTWEGGQSALLTREEILSDKALLLGIGEFIVTAAIGGKRIVENTRPVTNATPIGGGGQLVR